MIERFNQTLIKITKSLLQWSKLDLEFWDFAAKHANFIYNFTPHSGINFSIPYEIFHNEKVNLKYLKVFGCKAFYKVLTQNKHKFQPNANEGIHLGYDKSSNSYIIMDKFDKSIHFVREVVFMENEPAGTNDYLDMTNFINDRTDYLVQPESLENETKSPEFDTATYPIIINSNDNNNLDYEPKGDEFNTVIVPNDENFNNNNKFKNNDSNIENSNNSQINSENNEILNNSHEYDGFNMNKNNLEIIDYNQNNSNENNYNMNISKTNNDKIIISIIIVTKSIELKIY